MNENIIEKLRKQTDIVTELRIKIVGMKQAHAEAISGFESALNQAIAKQEALIAMLEP